MRNLFPILLLVVGLGVSACESPSDINRQDTEEALPAGTASLEGPEMSREEPIQVKNGTLPSRSKAAFPHAPGLSHVSVFSVYLTDTEPATR